MAISFLQDDSSDGGTSLAFGSSVGTGSLLLALIRRGGTASQPSSLSGGGTWTKDEEYTVSTDHTLGLWSCPNASPGSVTVVQTGGGGSSRMIIVEIGGIATTSPLDLDSSTTGTSATPTGLSITPSVSDSIVIGGFSIVSANSGAWTAGSGFTAATPLIDKVALVYKILTASSAQTPNVTNGVGSDTWGAISAVYKMAAGGGGSVPGWMMPPQG